jgi:hypothetical protein
MRNSPEETDHHRETSGTPSKLWPSGMWCLISSWGISFVQNTGTYLLTTSWYPLQ